MLGVQIAALMFHVGISRYHVMIGVEVRNKDDRQAGEHGGRLVAIVTVQLAVRVLPTVQKHALILATNHSNIFSGLRS